MARLEAPWEPYEYADPKFLEWKRRLEAGEPFLKDLQRLFGLLKLAADFEKTGAVFEALVGRHQHRKGQPDASHGAQGAEDSTEAEEEWQKLFDIRKRYDFLRLRANECTMRFRQSTAILGTLSYM